MITPAALRQRFLAEPLTLRNERRDFGDWHRGRPHYLLWAIDVDLPAVRSRITAAQRALDGLLLDGYRRQPHITLALCGFPARTARPAVDEFDRHWLQARIRHVDGAAGPLGALRACLHADTPPPQGEYVPHVTVGLYADAYPTHSVAQRFDACAPVVPLRCAIERISLMGYVAAEIGGALFTLAEWDLAAHRLQWRSRLAAAELFRCREPVRANRDTAPASDLPMEMP